MKRILACTLLTLPLAISVAPTQVKAAETLPTSVTTQSSVGASYKIARYVRRWVPGHWSYRHGRRYWVPGRWVTVWRRDWG
jgi:hypothetical protein